MKRLRVCGAGPALGVSSFSGRGIAQLYREASRRPLYEVWDLPNKPLITKPSRLLGKRRFSDSSSVRTIKTNALHKEKSPHLLQHADNPVNWLPYGADALRRAKEQDKILFISIGHATSFWCKEMNKNCFQDEEVAEALNRDFICIKVDKDEMPELEVYYMRAAQSFGVLGGWPLSVFATGDQKPFAIGRYFPKTEFLELLQKVKDVWDNEKSDVDKLALMAHKQVVTWIKPIAVPRLINRDPIITKLHPLTKKLHETDAVDRASSFSPVGVMFRSSTLNSSNPPDKFLDAIMAAHYDHLRGGFFRYNHDDRWKICSNSMIWEKALVDNAFHARAFLTMYQQSKLQICADLARKTLHYLLNDLENKADGGFYTGEDMDSYDAEHKRVNYYYWHYDAIKALLTQEEFDKVAKLYSLKKEGNSSLVPGLNFLHIFSPPFPQSIWDDPLVQSANSKLLAARNLRPRPAINDLQLLTPNSIMVQTLAKAYQTLGDKQYLEAAHRTINFIQKKLWSKSSGTLFRRYCKGETKYHGMLYDYANLILALLELYQADWNESWVDWAVELQKRQDTLFFDKDGGTGYFLTSREAPDIKVPGQMKETADGMYPSANSVSVLNNLHIWALTRHPLNFRRALDLYDYMVNECMPPADQTDSAISMLLLNTPQAPLIVPLVAIVCPPSAESSGTAAETHAGHFLQKLRDSGVPSRVAVTEAGRSSLPILAGKTCKEGRPTAYWLDTWDYIAHKEDKWLRTTDPEELVAGLRACPTSVSPQFIRN